MHGEPKSKSDLLKLTDGTLSEADARAMLERIRWPDGPHCPFADCGGADAYRIEVKPSTRKNGKFVGPRHLFKCKSCKRQFSVTKSTIFEDSKIPLRTWIMVMYRMCSSKKGVSAHQIHREFGVFYEAAWFMCHRIRYAMQDKASDLLTGIIEADETYIGAKTKRGHRVWRERIQDEIELGIRQKPGPKAGQPHPRMAKTPVFGILERGGRVRTMVIKEVNAKTVRPAIIANVETKGSRLITDAHRAYRLIRRELPHEIIRHEIEYVRDATIHIQGIENYWSLLKRGLIGTFHHVGTGYLPCYLNEFEFRFNRRKVSDAGRFYALLGSVEGRLTWYLKIGQAS